MNAVVEIIKIFERFIKRSLLPSSSFLLFLIIYDIFINRENPILDYLKKFDSTLMIIVIFMLFIGLSTILSILHQAVYDNFLKKDFELYFYKHTDNAYLKELREKVQTSCNRPKATDYLLYQLIKAKYSDLDTKRYVDDAKTIGISFISFIIILIATIVKIKSIPVTIGSIVLILFLYILGKELIKSKYRSRAIFLYTNYLNREK